MEEEESKESHVKFMAPKFNPLQGEPVSGAAAAEQTHSKRAVGELGKLKVKSTYKPAESYMFRAGGGRVISGLELKGERLGSLGKRSGSTCPSIFEDSANEPTRLVFSDLSKRMQTDSLHRVAFAYEQKPDITSGGIQHHRPIDGYKSFAGPGTAHLRAYVASGSPPGQYGGAHHGLQQQLSYQQASPSQQVNPAGGKFEEPYFDDTTPRNVTGLVGKSAYLSCRVKNLGNKTGIRFRRRQTTRPTVWWIALIALWLVKF
uniref:Ig-like domain-containing protein n=1 Tax=Anopheles farauti TaxID=69004 RepID=A0A182Q181_9DIPT